MYHRLYVMYTHLFQSLETSIRSIKAPDDLYLQWKHSLNLQGILGAFLSDKDTQYSDRSRLVPISAALRKQYAYYEKHISHLDLHLKSASVFIQNRRDKNPMFVLDSLNEFSSVSPSDFLQFLRHYTDCDVPSNFHRSFLRTESLRRGCPAEMVDAHLGHASFGESPQSWTSSYDFGMHMERIQAATADIHEEIGLVPIKSVIGYQRLRGPRQ